MDFAFFAVNFGYSKSDYEALTPREKSFIYKAWENKKVSDMCLVYNACYTAFFNANRSKKQRAIRLLKGRRQRVDENTVSENRAVIRMADKNDGDWIAKIYRANGLPYKRRCSC